jgi:hypothetical protein
MILKLSVTLLLMAFVSDLFSQEVKLSERISEIAEELAADENDPGAADIFSDMLYELTQYPVKINSGDEKEISRLFFLTDFQVKAIADYVRTNGMILTPFEIANIPGFDRETAETMIPFITLEKHLTLSGDSTGLKQTILNNFIYKTTPHDTSTLGSPWKILAKYKLTYNSFTFGFTAEKDPGEKLFSGKPPLPDFLSGYICYNGRGLIRRIIAGDFSARFGQGTNINTGMRTGLSLTAPGYLSARNEIRPYTSTDENNFFRGAATELTYKNFELALFYSMNRIDASLYEKTDSSISAIKAFYTSGLHPSEITMLKKDVVYESDFGANISCNYKNLRTGFIISETRFSFPVHPDQSDPACINAFTGFKNTLFTVYYNSLVKRAVLYGEISASELNRYAFVQGLSFRPAERLNLNLLYRNYSPGFVSFRGSGPVRSLSGSNEYGILGNFTFEAARFLFISAGTEMKYYPWLRYRCSSPSFAKRHEIRLKYMQSQNLTFEALYSQRSSVADNENVNKIPGQQVTIIKSVKGSVKFSPSEYLTLITRADYKTVDPSGNNGTLLLQDINLRLRRVPVSVWMRYSIFNTGGFDSGLYTWENDLLNSFSVPVLYGKGSHLYIMTSWKIFYRAELRIKYGITSTQVINFRMKETNEIKIQLRINI